MFNTKTNNTINKELSDTNMVELRDIYFNEEQHAYTDNFGNRYTSCTQLIEQYKPAFDKDAVAEACARAGRKGNPKYAGKTKAMLLAEWAKTTEEACDKGNRKHNYLEDAVKSANNYKRVSGTEFINDKIYTISDILTDHDFGRIDLDYFIETGIKDKYPAIFSLLAHFTKDGWRIYAEIGTYNPYYILSGLIDILIVKDNNFMVIDWKTNRDDITFEAGYFKKDNAGNVTTEFVSTKKYFNYPLNHLMASKGNTYTMQLSIYDYLVEQFGLNCKGNILCHIRDENYTDEQVNKLGIEYKGKERVDILPIKYLKKEVEAMFDHYKSTQVGKVNNQFKMTL